MQSIVSELDFLHTLHPRRMMNTSTNKVRRKLFADTSPLNYNKIKNDTARILEADYERFKAKYNYDFDANKPLPGSWAWLGVDSEKVPSFYTRPYPAKKAESLNNHLMACVKTRDQNIRNNFYHNGQFLSLATLMTPYTADEQTTTSTSSIRPVMLETPNKGATISHRSSSCATNKRKLSQTDFSEVNGDNEHISLNSSSSPLRSHSPSETETVSSTQLSSQSQDSVGQNLQNNPCTTATDEKSSSQSTQTSLLAQQDRQTRQTNITEFMKSQKNPSEPVAKHARRA